MNKYKIITIGYFIKNNNILNISMNSNNTLLDGDIIIINPGNIDWIIEENKYKNGGLNLINIISNKTREISALLKYGKIVIVFLSPVYSFEAKIGYNDTKTITNYDFLPNSLKYYLKTYIIGGAGSKILNCSKEYLSDFYKTYYNNNLEYLAYISENIEKDNRQEKKYFFKDFILRNKTNNLVGFAMNIDNGKIFFIPYINNENNPEKMINVVINLCSPFLEKDLKTPEPEWCKDKKFIISGENILKNKIKKQNNRINLFNKKIDELILQKTSLTDFRKLLYEKGPQLEKVVRSAFEVIGFNVSRFEKDDMEHDIIMESEEGRIIGEIEGKDNDAIHINKLDQLSRVIDEDFKNKGLYPEGILIGNAYRMKSIKERKKTFHDKVIISAKRKKYGLISTVEIFNAVKKILSSSNNNKIKKEFRMQIFNSLGEEIKFK